MASYQEGDMVLVYGRPFRVKKFEFVEGGGPLLELDVSTDEEVRYIREHYEPHKRCALICRKDCIAVLLTLDGVTPCPSINQHYPLQQDLVLEA